MATSRLDELIKEYLLFRGFTNTHKSFEAELKLDKDKGLRPEKIVEQLLSSISSYDLNQLREFWGVLNRRFFMRLETRYQGSTKKLEVSLLKFYLVHASQNKQQDKVMEFFEKMSQEIQNTELKDWFVFPFIKDPQDHSVFGLYFSKNWQDVFLLSLTNFFSVIIQSMPAPTLLNFDVEHRRMKSLHEENIMLRNKIMDLSKSKSSEPDPTSSAMPSLEQPNIRVANSIDMVQAYDFSEIGDDEGEEEKQKKKRFPLSFPSTTPLLGKKQATSKKDEKAEKTNASSKAAAKSRTVTRTHSATRPVNIQPKVRTETHSKVIQGQGSAAMSSSPATTSEDTHKTEAPSPSSRAEVQAKLKGMTETHIREREELLGIKQKDREEIRRKPTSVKATVSRQQSADVTSHRPAPGLRPGHSKSLEISCFPEESTVAGVTSESCPFILLSQEEYMEHRSAISSAKFSNTGQYISSVDVDGVVKVWTWSPQPSTSATVMSKSAFLSLDWASKSDRWLLLGNKSGNIRLFDVQEMKSFYEASGDSNFPRVVALCASPSGESFASSATVNRAHTGISKEDSPTTSINKVGQLTVWDLRRMKVVSHLPVEPDAVAINCCSFNHNGQLLLTGGADGVVRIFDVQQNTCLSAWEAHQGEIKTMQFSTDENSFFSLGTDEKFVQWSIHKPGIEQKTISIHEGASLPFLSSGLSAGREIPWGTLFALDAESQFVLTCDRSKGVIYKLSPEAKLSHLLDLPGHKANVTTVDWSPNIETRVCLTGAMDGKIKISTLLNQ